MWIFVAAVVVVAVGALVVAALMRPAGDDGSVRSYHSALGTLEHLSQPERRVRRPAARGETHDSTGAVPPVTAQGDEELPDGAEPLVFDGARPRDHYEPHRAESMPARSRRAEQVALDSMNRRPRRGIGVVLVVAAVVAFAALVYVGSRRGHPSAHPSTTPTTHARSVTATTAHHALAGHSHTRSSTTTSTAPRQIVALTSSSTGASATYSVGTASFTIDISASGPCWVDVTAAATGATLWTGTLQAGGTQTVPATGATTVELGATVASMTVDGTPVVFPTPMHTPFSATLQPAPSAAAPATTTPSAG